MSQLEAMNIMIKGTLYDAPPETRECFEATQKHLRDWYIGELKDIPDDEKAGLMLAIALFFAEVSEHEGNPPWLKEKDNA